jgi:hypothetical protein
MGDRGYERGLAEGYARAAADVKALQHAIVRDAELEARRWGLADALTSRTPRPGDFRPGRASARRGRVRAGGRMTERRRNPEEIERADTAYRQWWLWFLTLGLLASKPELEPELELY